MRYLALAAFLPIVASTLHAQGPKRKIEGEVAGSYFFGSHGGSVLLIVPEGTSATFNLASIHGSVTTNLNGTLQRLERGQRHSITVGTGGAIVEVETFGGRIAVMRQGTEGALQQ